MTYTPGDPGHMQAHADLVAAVNTELTRFGMLPDLPTRALGDEGHLDDHNAIRGALETIESTAGQTFSQALPPVRNLGDAGHPDDHSALEACALEASGWPAWNDATGGTITTFEDGQYPIPGRWRVHTFTAATDTLNVSLAVQPFRVLLVHGGGAGENGGYTHGGWGGGGGTIYYRDAQTLTVGQHAVAVGTGGSGSTGGGTASTLGALTSAGATDRPSGADGPAFDISGASVHYAGSGGRGGPTGNNINTSGDPGGLGGGGHGGSGRDTYHSLGPNPGGQGTDGLGGGGGGGGAHHQVQTVPSGRGGSGVVIVAYRIG